MTLTNEFKNMITMITDVIKKEVANVNLNKVNVNASKFVNEYTDSSLKKVNSAIVDMVKTNKIEITIDGILPKLEGSYFIQLRVKKFTSANHETSTTYTVDTKELSVENFSEMIQNILYNDFIFHIPLFDITSSSVTENNTLRKLCIENVITDKFDNIVPISLELNSKKQRILLTTCHKNYTIMGTRAIDLLSLNTDDLIEINSKYSEEKNNDLISLLEDNVSPFVTHNNKLVEIQNIDSTYFDNSFDVEVIESIRNTRENIKHELNVKYDSDTGMLTTTYMQIEISSKKFNIHNMNTSEYYEWKEDVVATLFDYLSLTKMY